MRIYSCIICVVKSCIKKQTTGDIMSDINDSIGSNSVVGDSFNTQVGEVNEYNKAVGVGGINDPKKKRAYNKSRILRVAPEDKIRNCVINMSNKDWEDLYKRWEESGLRYAFNVPNGVSFGHAMGRACKLGFEQLVKKHKNK
jgi:hypothetical protein